MKTRSMRLTLYMVAACALLLGLLTSAGAVSAATLQVDTLSDENHGVCNAGHCSLRDAISAANPGDTIGFKVNGTITLKHGELVINKNLTISGPGAAKLKVSGNNASRVMNVSATVSISGLTVTKGKAPSYDDGGGIWNTGTLTLNDCAFSSNSGDYGGGLHNDAVAHITNCTFSNNISPTAPDGGGAGFHNDGTATVAGSTFSGNNAKGGIGGAILNEFPSSLTVTGSTFSNNNAKNWHGGAISNVDSTLTVERSAFSGNAAKWGGAIKSVGALSSVQVTNSTFSANSATERGGGIDNDTGSTLNVLNSTFVKNSTGIAGPGASLTVKNSIVANSKDNNCEGAFGGGSTNNLSTDSSCSPGFTQVTSTQLALGGLTGKPGYFPLKPGSFAIEKGTNTGCPAIDQRNYPRPLDGDHDGTAICDVGSYEAEWPPNTKWDAQFAAPGATAEVLKIMVKGPDIYVGGNFATIANVPVNNIARYSTAKKAWYSLGGGVNGEVYALLAVGSKIYVGGAFSQATNPDAGKVAANNIAIWDSTKSQWLPIMEGANNGVGGDVYALASLGSGVFAAGAFTAIGPHTPQHIARWDTNTQTWSNLQEGVNGEVYALKFIGQQLFAGGSFTSAGNKPHANHVALFDTKTDSWEILGTDAFNGVLGKVYALEAIGNYVCIGGDFTQMANPGGYVTRNHIACGNNNPPHGELNLGSGLNSTVSSLVRVGNDLYAGGHFTLANPGLSNQLPVNYVARWNKNTKAWFALGSGVDNDIITLAAKGNDVYAGGIFSKAGEKSAPFLAKWKGP